MCDQIIGKVKPTFADGIWTYTEELYEQSYMKAYPNDDWDCAAYINNPDKAIFLAYSGMECIGQIGWAENSDLRGLALETQDNNLLACRFYAKCGFVVGAVNTMLYRNFDNSEFAIFWYLSF